MHDDEYDFGEPKGMSSKQKKYVIKKKTTTTISCNGINFKFKGTGVELRTHDERSGAQAECQVTVLPLALI